MELTLPAVPYMYCTVYCMCTECVLYCVLVKHNTANVAVPFATGMSKGHCTVAETSVRLNHHYGRAKKVLRLFRPTLPTNNVRKRFVAKNVSGNTRDVKVQLKVEDTNEVLRSL